MDWIKLLEFGPWSAVIAVVYLFISARTKERRRVDTMFENHLKNVRDDHEKLASTQAKMVEVLQEILLRLRQMNGK